MASTVANFKDGTNNNEKREQFFCNEVGIAQKRLLLHYPILVILYCPL